MNLEARRCLLLREWTTRLIECRDCELWRDLLVQALAFVDALVLHADWPADHLLTWTRWARVPAYAPVPNFKADFEKAVGAIERVILESSKVKKST